jgi:hypothetical protein
VTGREKSGSCVRNPGSALAIAIVAALLACAGTEKTAAPPPSGVISEGVASETATVEKIDVAKRLVTLRGADGRTIEMKVDESVRNLPQVKKGDLVVVKYYESLAYDVRRPGEVTPGYAIAEGGGRAKPGAKPAGVAAREVQITTTIDAIDKTNETVTLKGPEGNLVTVKVRDPSKLDAVKVGDLVQITYSQALAISVEEVPK